MAIIKTDRLKTYEKIRKTKRKKAAAVPNTKKITRTKKKDGKTRKEYKKKTFKRTTEKEMEYTRFPI